MRFVTVLQRDYEKSILQTKKLVVTHQQAATCFNLIHFIQQKRLAVEDLIHRIWFWHFQFTFMLKYSTQQEQKTVQRSIHLK